MIALNKTIRLFLDGIGRREEYEFYLERFRSDEATCFALLCPDAESIEAGAEVLAFDLRFLLRLELAPAILLCGPDAGRMEAALRDESVFDFRRLEAGSPGAFVRDAKRAGRIPVLTAPDESRESALERLVPATSRRVHFVRAAGGLRNDVGESLPYVYVRKENPRPLEALEFDYPALARRLLDRHPALHLSVTSPIDLLQEIFTVKGAGTLFRRGSEILRFEGAEGPDRERLVGLLESAFGRPLRECGFLNDVASALVERDYRGAALMERTEFGPYLSKFAVERAARGEGLAQELWEAVCRAHPAFFWRSASSNPFNSWYERHADGSHRAGKWRTFWRGVEPEAISGIVAYCANRAEDFDRA